MKKSPLHVTRVATITSAASRRAFLGVCALAGSAGAIRSGRAEARWKLAPDIVRKWYSIWDTTKDWRQADSMLADDFTFTSAAGDDHISKTEFKKKCWDTQIDLIQRADLLHISISGSAAFVMYNCLTRNAQSFKNVEFLEFRDERIKSIECYFGAPSNYPSAVSKRQER